MKTIYNYITRSLKEYNEFRAAMYARNAGWE